MKDMGCLVDDKKFLDACKSINKNLSGQVANRVFNSIGSHIFFEFGETREFVFPNGKKGAEKEWCIWIGHASWRISQGNQYLIGSGENPETKIQPYIEELLGARFQSFQFISHFLDAEFIFDGGYKLVTFFNWASEDQLVVFTPDKNNIAIDCSAKEKVSNILNLSKKLKIKDKYRYADFHAEIAIDKITYNLDGFVIRGTDYFLVDTGKSAWRITKNSEYLVGHLDYYFACQEGGERAYQEKVSHIIGNKLTGLALDDLGLDAKIQLGQGYVLELFTTAKADQWNISQNREVIFPP